MKKLVSASLAGALAVGMVPAMALAAEGADADLELMVTEDEAINKGSIVLKAGQTEGQEFEVGSKGYLEPVQVRPMDVTAESGYKNVTKFTVMKVGTTSDSSWGWVENGKTLYYTDWTTFVASDKSVEGHSGSAPLDLDNLAVGKYAVGAWVDGNYVAEVVTFSVTAKGISGIEFFDATLGNDAKSKADEVLTYKGTKYDLGEGVAAEKGLGLKIGDEDVTSKFEINKISQSGLVKDALYAGTYDVEIEGTSGEYLGQTAKLQLTINPFDLANAVIVMDDLTADEAKTATTDIVSINGVAKSGFADDPILKYVELKSADDITKPGTYNAVVGLKAGLAATPEAGSIVGQKNVTFVVAGAVDHPFAVNYDPAGNDWDKAFVEVPGTPNELVINYAVTGAKAWDEASIAATYDDPSTAAVNAAEKALTAEQIAVSYVKVAADGVTKTACTAADLANPGSYEVTVNINASAFEYAIAGTPQVLKVTVTDGTVAASAISVTYKGKGVYDNLIDSAGEQLVYTGADVMADVAFTLRDAKGTVVPASEYTLEIKKVKDAQGTTLANAETVSAVIDAGTYEVVVKSDSYKIDANKLTIVVPQTSVAGVVIDGAYDMDDVQVDTTGTKANDVQVLFYTGKEVVPTLQYDNPLTAKTGDLINVPAGYKLTVKNYVDKDGKAAAKMPTSIVEEGVYTLTIADDAKLDNYSFVGADIYLVVTKKTAFTDVLSSDWYADPVTRAAQLKIVNGIAGTTLFKPEANMKRADYVCMIYNLSKVVEKKDISAVTDGNQDSSINGYASFSDVQPGKYYAAAVQWAKDAGIVNGDAGKDTFRPEDTITRQEGMAILANFAQAYKLYEAPEGTAALTPFKDAASVSNWAKTSMAWGVENGLVGNGGSLNGKGLLNRAMGAAYMMNFYDAFIAE